MHRDDTPESLPAGFTPDDTESCQQWEAALVDLLDGTLKPEQETALRRHTAGCAECRALLDETSRGQAWARLLHEAPPVVPEALLGKILARTAESAIGEISPGHTVPGVLGSSLVDPMFDATLPGMPVPAGNVLVLPSSGWSLRGQREARLLMTAAMAFFSIALTLSLTGVRLADLRSPASFSATASRQFFDTKKQVVSFYDNLRLVREMEATVQDLRHSASNELEKNKRTQHGQPSARRTSDAAAAAAAPLFASGVPVLAGGAPAFLIPADERTTL